MSNPAKLALSTSQSSKNRAKLISSKRNSGSYAASPAVSRKANQQSLRHASFATTSTSSIKRLQGSGITPSSVGNETVCKSLAPIIKSRTELDPGNCSCFTPPVHASVSPDILCQPSIITPAQETPVPSGTPACYGAGHLLYKVTDKRKCRPIGLLTFHEAIMDSNVCDNLEDDRAKTHNAVKIEDDASAFQSPIQASVHWLLSTSSVVAGDESPNRAAPKVGTVQSSGTLVSSTFSYASVSSLAPLHAKSEKRVDMYVGDESSFSVDTLNSDNVMQTPESESNGKSATRRHPRGLEIQENCIDGVLGKLVEPAESTPSSQPLSDWLVEQSCSEWAMDGLTQRWGSVSHCHFDADIDNRDCILSSTCVDSVPQSPVRISWREDLISQTLDVDNSDCCRCFSDEEPDSIGFTCSGDDAVGAQIPTGFETCKPGDSDLNVAKEMTNFCSCAESISTVGGSLMHSDDSDWAVCYRNCLLRESDAM